MKTVAATYLKSAIETCVAEGCSESELLKAVPGGKTAFSNILGRLPVNVFYDVLYRAEELLGETGIGVKIGLSFRPSTFLHFGYGLISSANLREALDFNWKYQAVNQQLGRAKLALEDRSAFVEWESEEEAEYARPAVETVLTGYVGVGKWITWTHGDEIKSMRFRHQKPAHADLVEKAFECPIYYGEPVDRLEFDAQIVDKPMPAGNPLLVKQLSKRLDKVLLSIHDPSSVRLAVYRIIEPMLADGAPSAARVAKALGLSERTLRRRLADERQTFRGILAQVRQDICQIYMTEPKLTMTEISQLLGYSEHSAFIRAFRGWFGMTPTEYRAGAK